jgi:hypothetical protein
VTHMAAYFQVLSKGNCAQFSKHITKYHHDINQLFQLSFQYSVFTWKIKWTYRISIKKINYKTTTLCHSHFTSQVLPTNFLFPVPPNSYSKMFIKYSKLPCPYNKPHFKLLINIQRVLVLNFFCNCNCSHNITVAEEYRSRNINWLH